MSIWDGDTVSELDILVVADPKKNKFGRHPVPISERDRNDSILSGI